MATSNTAERTGRLSTPNASRKKGRRSIPEEEGPAPRPILSSNAGKADRRDVAAFALARGRRAKLRRGGSVGAGRAEGTDHHQTGTEGWRGGGGMGGQPDNGKKALIHRYSSGILGREVEAAGAAVPAGMGAGGACGETGRGEHWCLQGSPIY